MKDNVLPVRLSALLVALAGFLVGWRSESMEKGFRKEVRELGLTPGAPGGPVTEADLTPLPAATQKYMRAMDALGLKRDWSFRARFTGEFRLGPEKPWMRSEVFQFNSRLDTARIFHMRCAFMGPLYFVARDTFVKGSGRMLGKLMDLFTVADGQGEEYDIGELVTYLNDAVLMAPTFLIDPKVSFAGVSDDAFDVSLTEGEHTVKARVVLDPEGRPADFVTTDRFLEDFKNPGGPLVRGEWHTPMEGYHEVGGRWLPARGKGMWRLETGDYVYADFLLDTGGVAFNVNPGQ